MTVHELNRNQLNQLKENILVEEMDATGDTPSYRELMESHDIPDEAVYEKYSGVDFTEDDFFGDDTNGGFYPGGTKEIVG